ncbi:hypothetical protein [Geosporobacter ferrireducens]|uniref:Uncharacterized protein n=1 Tax=Geosporobacter ferrireducens TaxID=1424294 RepID=A0A1D8GBP8_9FIRM|nr:hypothetical protein [Geosporobacter ferrireducens]AOT68342.1 hypothetical protein Gferi_01280 [Geosporobacter ferrireducens]
MDNINKRILTMLLAFLLTISSLGLSMLFSYASTHDNWRAIEIPEETGIKKPKATLRAEINGDTKNPIVAYEGKELGYKVSTGYAKVGDRAAFYGPAGMHIYDFQYRSPSGFKKEFLGTLNGKEIYLDEAGEYHVYLQVAIDKSYKEWTYVWSENGSHSAIGEGYLPGKTVTWYFVELIIIVEEEKPMAEFEIHHDNKNVTDNINNPIQVEEFPFSVNLIDKSTVPAGTTIISWEWQGSTGNDWVPLSTQKNFSDSVPGSWKSYRLRVTNNKGVTSNWVQHDVYAQKKGEPAPEPPPASDNAEINAKLKIDPYPRKVPIKYDAYYKNETVQINMELDASGSTSSKGIKDYLFYYRINGGDWTYLNWTSSSKVTVNLNIRKSHENASGKIPIQARVGVRDIEENTKYANDSSEVEFEIQMEPPETELQLPNMFYPKEITTAHPTIKNTITWSYEGERPYKKSIVSLYRYNETDEVFEPIFNNLETIERKLDVVGDPDELQKIEVKVIDTADLESEKVEQQYIYENAYPKIKVVVDASREAADGEVDITVNKLTGPEVEAIFPTEYTAWTIIDAYGNSIANGAGKLPEKMAIDERFKANAVVFKQYAKNNLGYTTSDKDFYKNNSTLDFLLEPTRLFESELAQVKDFSESILNKEWMIKRTSDPEYSELTLDEENKFTQNAGIYIVKLEGDARFVLSQNMYQYTNNKDDLKQVEPVELTNAQILEKHGEGFIYAQNSAKWLEGETLEQGKYTADGKTYSFRRRLSYLTIREYRTSKERQVEFISGTPVADFVKVGEDKVFKKQTLDGSNSVNVTNQELQQRYPILFDHERTKFVIEPITGPGGEVDTSLIQHIKGEEKITGGSGVEFRGKKFQDFRVDKSMDIRVRYTVFNGLKNSPYAVKEFYIEPDLEPTVDIDVLQSVVYREAENELKSKLRVVATYNSPDDEIDLEKSKLLIYYDKDNNGEYNDGEQWIMKEDRSLAEYLSIEKSVFGENQAEFIMVIDNEEKNVLGRFKFEFVAVEKPKTPNFEIPGESIPVLSANTFGLEDTKKVIYIDNHQPVITLETRRGNKNEVWIIETHDAILDYQTILNQLGLNKLSTIVYIIKKDNSIQVLEN